MIAPGSAVGTTESVSGETLGADLSVTAKRAGEVLLLCAGGGRRPGLGAAGGRPARRLAHAAAGVSLTQQQQGERCSMHRITSMSLPAKGPEVLGSTAFTSSYAHERWLSGVYTRLECTPG